MASSRDDAQIPESRRPEPALQAAAKPNLRWHYQTMPQETHATSCHPAALPALRVVFAPKGRAAK